MGVFRLWAELVCEWLGGTRRDEGENAFTFGLARLRVGWHSLIFDKSLEIFCGCIGLISRLIGMLVGMLVKVACEQVATLVTLS